MSDLISGQVLWIPKVDLDIERSYRELCGKHLRNRGWQQMYIDEALQHVNFQLDERGTTLSSTARLKVKSGGDDARFVFDNPFLIILRQTGSQRPYFAAWIGNAELLHKM